MKKDKKSPRRALRVLLVLIIIGAVAFGSFTYWVSVPFVKNNAGRVKAEILPFAEMTYEPEGPGYEKRFYQRPGDKIHFLNTGPSDTILLESVDENGVSIFALVDCGEDTDYPEGKDNIIYDGYEKYVIDYIHTVAGNQGREYRTYLDFVVGTHSHSDHIGGFDSLFADEEITVGEVYLKKYDPIGKNMAERSWDNEEVYGQMVGAANARGFELIQDIPSEPFTLGNMKISFYNTGESKNNLNGGENDNSLGVLVEVNGKRAFLAGDINNWSGTEREVSKQVGRVDLVKAGHHGHLGSGSVYFGAGLRPEHLVVTGAKVPWISISNYAVFAKSTVYCTADLGGVIAELKEDKISFYEIGEFDNSEPACAYFLAPASSEEVQ